MKKTFLLIAVISAFILSCEKEDSNQLPSTELERKLDEYGLFNTEKNIEGYKLGIDTNIIYFNGREDEKLCMESFNILDKANLLSWKSKDNLKIEVYEGYGVNSTHEISKFEIVNPYNHNDNHVFILWGIAEGAQYAMNRRIITSDLYFTSNEKSKKFESLTYPSKAYFFYDLIPWYEDNIIVTKLPSESSSDPDSCFCYSMQGDELFKFVKAPNFYPKENYIPVSSTNYIIYTGAIDGQFLNNNIKEAEQVWEKKMPFNDLPDDTRIDKVELSRLNSSHVLCKFSYTLYSGETGSREVTVEIETGIIEER